MAQVHGRRMKDGLSASLSKSMDGSQYKWDGRRRRPTRRVRPTGIKVSKPGSKEDWFGTEAKTAVVSSFFASGELFDWGLFCASVLGFLLIHSITSTWSTNMQSQSLTFLIWILFGACYNAAIFSRLGEEQGLLWLDGFLLELIFSMENVFVFHIIVEAFSTPARPLRKALFVVVCWQNVYDMVLYMGLATWLDSLILLPYLLGIWLVYVGFQAATTDNHEPIADIMHTTPVIVCRAMLGNRLYLHYDHESPCAVFGYRKAQADEGGPPIKCEQDDLASVSSKTVFDGTSPAKKRNQQDGCHMSLLGLVILCLLLADFVLEIDVTLTKIESLQDQHISFTSSALASFAMPALYFLVRDLFDRFSLLKYGIAFVLVFFGVQMLFCSVFRLSPLEGCGIIVAVMIFCVIASPAKPVPETEREKVWGSLSYGTLSFEGITNANEFSRDAHDRPRTPSQSPPSPL